MYYTNTVEYLKNISNSAKSTKAQNTKHKNTKFKIIIKNN